ncbi:alpha,alpha-trehalose-phosphate synthase (UDP-forming) [Stackebrandtia nassauensis]|uniref:Alpha,alpha-trehalose-phosphate synthase (UDP-forming) n=1 Tax=Stackebrandtia nassauensis (strain DSM 44728 / CIP 108903 / NRRL B-16338 / NBRC 102104 / LLR-40K-21) TaxID=446470 RepID=D3Q6P2_STANL|nr:trehalose-6-phosphate synthase [Stackebrandtia nassauensis]ADD44285.1 Alpha,alpha-trehalose-phosphate synthase (UDP- forming) [Stackebrandtia nassauensis DSM 44728]
MSGSEGSAFVVVANRLPVDRIVAEDGRTTEWRRSPGGLVTALQPVLQAAEKGTWIGWSGDSSHIDPFTLDDMRLHPIPLDDEELRNYYEGFSNASLWPLYHDAVEQPIFRRRWWTSYERVNARFAERAASVAARGAVVWVQDYQLQLVPAMLRRLRPDVRIGFFLHIPFPPVELFMQLPRRLEILHGLLGADVIGFQQPLGAQNFLRLTRHLLDMKPKGHSVMVDDREVKVESFPISIDTASVEELAASEKVTRRAKEIRAELGDPRNIILGVDRLDYTKGIEHRLKAYRELLSEGRLAVPETVMVQVATPSRERVEHYRTLRSSVEREVGRINGDFGQVGLPAIHYLHQSYDRAELAALYRVADVMVVTPLRDGMNLVAKEYVSSRPDGDGALVLSEFTGAASDLKQAYQVNPHDLDEVKAGLLRAIQAPESDRRKRMRAMRRHLRGHDVKHWARGFLTALGVPETATAYNSGKIRETFTT